MSTGNEVPKPRRRSGVKSTKKQGEKPVKVGLYLSLDAARRLGVTATMEGLDRSHIVDELIRTHLRKYVVQVRSGHSSADEGSDSDENLD